MRRRPARAPRTDVTPMRKPNFTQLNELEPEMRSINVKCKAATPPKRVSDYWEVLVGDSTACILLNISKQDLAESIKPESSIVVRNGFVLMKDEKFMRLAVNMWGKIEVSAEAFEFAPNTSENLSAVEYELAS